MPPRLDRTGAVAFDGAGQFLEEFERNLRHKGLQVETEAYLEVLERLNIRLVLPTGGPALEVDAQVVAVAGSVASLALDLRRDDEERLARAAVELVGGRSGFAPRQATRELLRPITGKVTLHDVAPVFSGELTGPFSFEDLADALVDRPVDSSSLARTTLPRLLRNMAARRLTGRLMITGDGCRKEVYFFAGNPSSIVSDPPRASEQLGQLLLNLGRLDAETLDSALGRARASGHRLGSVIVQMGVLAPEQLDSILHFQVEVRLRDLLTWPRASYAFEAGRDPRLEEEAQPVRPHAFLARHAQRFLEDVPQPELETRLGRDLERFARPRIEEAGELALDATQLLMIGRQLDPEKTLRQIAEQSPLGTRATLRMLVLLRAAGALDLSDVPGSMSGTSFPAVRLKRNTPPG